MCVREIDPKETTRTLAFELWMKAPNPMVTFFKIIRTGNIARTNFSVFIFNNRINSKFIILYQLVSHGQ